MLWPEDGNIEHVPDDLAGAIDQAARILSWQENLSSDEMPPSWMWHLDWKLETWFEKVDNNRREKYGTGDSSSKFNSDDYDENEYAARFKK